MADASGAPEAAGRNGAGPDGALSDPRGFDGSQGLVFFATSRKAGFSPPPWTRRLAPLM